MSARAVTANSNSRSYSTSGSPLRDGNVKMPPPVPFQSGPHDSPDSQRLHSSEAPSVASLRQALHSNSSALSPSPHASRPTTYHNAVSSSNSNASPHTPQEYTPNSMSKEYTLHRRRGSALKTVMRKLFGRKLPDQPDSALVEERPIVTDNPEWVTALPNVDTPFVTVADSVRTPSHRAASIPNQNISAANSPTNNAFQDLTEPSLPWTRPNKPSHLDLQNSRRRATLPSVVLSPSDAGDFASALSRASSRPSSAHSNIESRAPLASLRSKTPSIHHKRRSRSASALREIARAHRMSPIQWRRRSDEIKYWRSSMAQNNESQSILTRPGTRSTIAPTVEESNEDEQEQQRQPTPQNPVRQTNGTMGGESFHFGTLMGNLQENSDASLVQRINTLEVKLMDLELAIAKLQGNQISPLQKTGFGSRSRPRTPSQQEEEEEEEADVHDPGPFISSFTSTPSTTPSRNSPDIRERPRSTGTLRAHTSSQHLSISQVSPMSGFSGISVEQYSALTTLVRREQSARKHLEEQLLQLQRDVAQMRRAQEADDTPGSFLLPTDSYDGSMFGRSGRTPFSSSSDNSLDTRGFRGLHSGSAERIDTPYGRYKKDSAGSQLAGLI